MRKKCRKSAVFDIQDNVLLATSKCVLRRELSDCRDYNDDMCRVQEIWQANILYPQAASFASFDMLTWDPHALNLCLGPHTA